MDLAFSLDFDRAGRRRDARMAMMAMTTSNSIRVKPRDVFMGSAPDNAPGRRRLQRSFFAEQNGDTADSRRIALSARYFGETIEPRGHGRAPFAKFLNQPWNEGCMTEHIGIFSGRHDYSRQK